MSWLFGLNKNQAVPQIPILPDGLPAAGQPGSGGVSPPQQGQPNKTKMDAYTFDSAALERAAKAAKELESSS